MNQRRDAGRDGFSVVCACGISYNTDDRHIGKQIKCRCGRTVSIVRSHAILPNDNGTSATASEPPPKRRRSSSARSSSLANSGSVRKRISQTGAWFLALWTDALRATASDRVTRRWSARLAGLWTVSMVATWLLLITTSESFLPAMLLAYGPRFVVLVPLVILVPATLIFARIAMLPLAIGIWIALGPVMGGRVSWHTIGSAVPTSRRANTVRVLTYNTQGGRVVALNIRSLLERVQPDLIAFQECGDQLWDTLQAMPTWHGSRHASLCTASRWEIASAEAMPNADFARIAQFGFGGTGLVARYVLNTPQGPLIFVNLHLETARKGLEALTSQDGLLPDRASSLRGPQLKQLADAENRIDLNAQIRDRESERAAVWVAKGDKRVPLLVAGDFNIPVESTIFREHWSDFTDAFESTGTGFGWSKREGTWLHIRIDHVLGNSTAPAPVGAWLERDLGSDHLPVVADLRWGAR